jgi:hypothetical protein
MKRQTEVYVLFEVKHTEMINKYKNQEKKKDSLKKVNKMISHLEKI